MRVLLLALTLLGAPWLALAAPAKPESLAPLFELAGVRLLCEQSAPLIQRGLPPEQQKQVATAFAADALCRSLARRVALQLSAEEVAQARALLAGELAGRFTEAERAVGEDAEGLASYAKQLAERPPLAARIELVRELDRQAHTSELAARLRYEAGKTQAWLAVKARGEQIDEKTLNAQTQEQRKSLRRSSRQNVETFMLYAYRRMPSEELQQYVELYRQPALQKLLAESLKQLPRVFAAQRRQLK